MAIPGVAVDNGISLQPGITRLLVRGGGITVSYVSNDTAMITVAAATTPNLQQVLAAGSNTGGLPTSDPHVLHQLWSNSGVVTESAG